MLKRFVGISAIVLIASSCATHSPTWKKQGVSYEDTTNALSECKYQVKLNKLPAAEQDEVIHHCMQAKGFRYY